MKLFPYILARVGGTTFSKVETLSFEKMSFVKILLEKESNLESQFEKVLQTFEETIEESNDYRDRAILNNGKKDFKNHRFSFLKKLKKINQEELLTNLLFNISVYSDRKIELENLKNEFDFIFQKEELFQYTFLQGFFQNEDFQNSLLQSSHSLYHQNKKLTLKSPLDFKKKERQTLRALAQYFYRIGAKTSPFSHFTTLDILSEKDGVFKNGKLENGDNLFQFNNFILSEMKNILLQDSSFYHQLKLKVNPSIFVQNEDFHFIKNDKNIETVQQIETSIILKELSQTIIPKEGALFEIVVIQLLELVEANQENLEKYLLELIELGFLEWDWGFSGLTFDWELKLQKIIHSMDTFLNKKDWTACLEKMIHAKVQMGVPDDEIRFLLQKSIKSNLEELGIKNIIPELILFEDVQKTSSFQLSENEIKPIIKSLDSLLRLLEPLVEDEMKNRILNCWIQNFSEEQSIPLIFFYEKLYQTPFDNAIANTFTNARNNSFFKEIKLGIKKNGVVDENGNLHFSIKDLKNIFPQNKKQAKSQYSGLFQFYKNEGKTKAVINGLTPGFGKLFGRFLPLFENEITIQLQKWNTRLQGKECWVENVDASIFNANLHPSLLNFEITNSKSQNNIPIENKIKLNDLEVCWDEDLNEPILSFSKTKKRISVFDCGFEHPENRSPMFQLLNGFSIPHATYRFFLKLVNELFFDEEPNRIKDFRRVVIDEHLVLQRQFSEVPNSFFPKKEKSESNSSYFLKIQKWRIENDIPQFIFIQPIQDTENPISNLSRDFFKPQLIDLISPIAIVLLQKVLEKHSGRIRIIEMLPNGEQLIGYSVAEFAVQWKLDEQLNR